MQEIKNINEKISVESTRLFQVVLQNAIIKVLEEIKYGKSGISKVLDILNSDNSSNSIAEESDSLSGWNKLKDAQLEIFDQIEKKFGISLDFIRDLAHNLTFNRPQYIQLLKMFLDCFTLDGVKLKSTFDQELESRFLINYIFFLNKLIVLQLNEKVSSKVFLEFISQGIFELYQTWEEQYFQYPMAYISLANAEIQDSIRLCEKYGSESEKQERIKLINELNAMLSVVIESDFQFNYQDIQTDSTSEEIGISANTSSVDLITGSETAVKRACSIIKKLINNRKSNQFFSINDIYLIVSDIGRATKLLDSEGKLAFDQILKYLDETVANLETSFKDSKVLTLNGVKYKIIGITKLNLIKFKLTFFSDLGLELGFVLLNTETKEYLFFNTEGQGQTSEALAVKHLEDPLYAYRKEIRTDLKNLENFNIFTDFLIDIPKLLQPNYFKLLGINNHYVKSELCLNDFIHSREYSNLYFDTFLARFPAIVSFILSLLQEHPARSKIFRLMQNIIPLSYAMRRSIFEAREIYKDLGVLESAQQAQDMYNELVNKKMNIDIIADIVDLNLDSVATISASSNSIIYDKIDIGELRVWSKLLRRPKEKVLEGINLLLAPNWHSGSNGTEKIPQSNTRIVVINQYNKIALLENEKYKEIDLPGSDTFKLLKDTANQELSPDIEKYCLLKISQQLKIELGLPLDYDLDLVCEPYTHTKLGYTLLSKKVKFINLLKLKTNIDLTKSNPNIIWIDPIELFLWKYWLDKDIEQRPQKYKLPLAPYSTFTEQILLDLESKDGIKYDHKMISTIKTLIRETQGKISLEQIRNVLNLRQE